MEPEFTISKRMLRAALKNEEASAHAANLTYTRDTIPGIVRKKRGNKFIYIFNNKEIRDTETLLRIKSLAIPPAWENVWICNNPEGHLQVTGYDKANRKQYRYHPLWNIIRSHTKYFRLLEFGLSLSEIRRRIDADLRKQGMSREKVLALVVSVLDNTSLRIGNTTYEKLNGSYGLTTLKNKHVNINGSIVKFCFIGKKGIRNNVTLRSKRLTNIIRKCKEIPGKQLFEYVNEDGSISNVDSGMVNEYLKEITGKSFTAKDFRTWAGSVCALRTLLELEPPTSQSDMKRKILLMYDKVALDLGNTRNVCKTHYIHPIVVKKYEENTLKQHYDYQPENENEAMLKPDELRLLSVLKML